MANTILIDFGKRVKQFRLKKGLTQVQLANKGDFDRNYIGMIERGERNPSLISLQRLAGALDVDLSLLIKFERR